MMSFLVSVWQPLYKMDYGHNLIMEALNEFGKD